MADNADSVDRDPLLDRRTAAPAELSYLSLVERNNELLERLVDTLRGYEIPAYYHPFTGRHMLRLPSRNAADQLRVLVDVSAGGITVHLETDSGNRLRSVVWDFAGEPWPQW